MNRYRVTVTVFSAESFDREIEAVNEDAARQHAEQSAERHYPDASEILVDDVELLDAAPEPTPDPLAQARRATARHPGDTDMTCTIRTEADGRMTIITPPGNVARMTDCRPFITADNDLAAESLEFLNQATGPGDKRQGSHRMKSMWGTFG